MLSRPHSAAEYVITERRERLDAAKNKVFDLLLSPSSQESSAKRIRLSGQDWQTFTVGDVVGYEAGKLWHKELPDQPVEARSRRMMPKNEVQARSATLSIQKSAAHLVQKKAA